MCLLCGDKDANMISMFSKKKKNQEHCTKYLFTPLSTLLMAQFHASIIPIVLKLVNKQNHYTATY